MKRKFFTIFLILFFSITSFSLNSYGWSIHGVMTSKVIEDIDWLSKFSNITITEYNYGDIDTEPYNPQFEIVYKEGYIGEKTSAFEILSIYTDEPDWDMDQNLKLSPFQKLTGGSSGWRHQYFITLFGLIRLGDAPKRAQYFYNLALRAFDRDDYYWGFRFFARALHYAEDVSQPLHSMPLPYSVILKNIFDINGLIKIGENHHYAFEDYQEVQTNYLSGDYIRDDYLEVLSIDETMNVRTIKRLAVLNAFKARRDSGKIFKIQEDFYEKEINNKEGFTIVKENYKKEDINEYQKDYDEIIKRNLKNFVITVNTALKLLYEDLIKMGVIQ